MTIPLWAPFALLTVVCTVYPMPASVRRLCRSVDWVLVAAWTVALVYSVAVWYGVFRLAGWVA